MALAYRAREAECCRYEHARAPAAQVSAFRESSGGIQEKGASSDQSGERADSAVLEWAALRGRGASRAIPGTFRQFCRIGQASQKSKSPVAAWNESARSPCEPAGNLLESKDHSTESVWLGGAEAGFPAGGAGFPCAPAADLLDSAHSVGGAVIPRCCANPLSPCPPAANPLLPYSQQADPRFPSIDPTPRIMAPSVNSAKSPPDAVQHEPSVGTGGFLVTGSPSLWFTPHHLLAVIRPEVDSPCLLSNPPFSAPAGRC